MSIESQLAEMEELESRMTQARDADHLDAMYQEQDDKMSAFIDSLEGLNQNQFVRYMDLVREMSWDIPSALMAVCSHGSDDSDEVPFFMHRPAWRIHAEGGRGPDGLFPIEYEQDNNFWEVTDQHFGEVHGLDLKDSRINWKFDT